MIDQKLVQKNKQLLMAERARLQKLLRGIGPEHEELGSSEDENAAEVTMYERNVVEEHDLRRQLQKVEAALQRIAAKTYGVCARGGEEISAARLAAAPEAANCVEHDEQ